MNDNNYLAHCMSGIASDDATIKLYSAGIVSKIEAYDDSGVEETPDIGKNDELFPTCESQPCNFVKIHKRKVSL